MPPAACKLLVSDPAAAAADERAAADLPPALRDFGAALADLHRDLMGRPRPLQFLIDHTLDRIEALVEGGVRHADLVAVLARLGIAARSGDPVSEATLSSAIARARREAGPAAARPAARPAGRSRRHAPAASAPGEARPDPARSGSPRQGPAKAGSPRHDPAPDGVVRQDPAASGMPRQGPATSGAPAQPAPPPDHRHPPEFPAPAGIPPDRADAVDLLLELQKDLPR